MHETAPSETCPVSTPNPYHFSGSIVYIECRNTVFPTFVTASADSYDDLKQYRWRIIKGECVTTVPHGLTEVKATLQHMVSKKQRTTPIRFKNNNPLDCRKENLVLPWSKAMSSASVQNGVGILHLKNGIKAQVDIQDLPFVEQFNWTVAAKQNVPTIYHYQQMPDRKYRRVFLPRYLLGVDTATQKRVSVKHKNGNPLDCRRDNLELVRR